MEPTGSEIQRTGVDVDGLDGAVELRPARALAAILVAGGAGTLCLMPAAIALGVVRLQLEQLAPGLAGLAVVVGGVKLLVAASAVAGRAWSGHVARSAIVRAG